MRTGGCSHSATDFVFQSDSIPMCKSIRHHHQVFFSALIKLHTVCSTLLFILTHISNAGFWSIYLSKFVQFLCKKVHRT